MALTHTKERGDVVDSGYESELLTTFSSQLTLPVWSPGNLACRLLEDGAHILAMLQTASSFETYSGSLSLEHKPHLRFLTGVGRMAPTMYLSSVLQNYLLTKVLK